jgi:hypothetical protein
MKKLFGLLALATFFVVGCTTGMPREIYVQRAEQLKLERLVLFLQ